jgi:hypothetical protein
MSSKSEKKRTQALMDEENSRAMDARAKIVNEAKSYNFINAVFCIYSYNNLNKFSCKNMPDISPHDVFSSFDKKEYALAIEKCEIFIKSGIKHGNLALTATRHRDKEKYKEIIGSFRLANPGFNEENLEKALNHGMFVMK